MALSRQHPVLSPLGCLGGIILLLGVALAIIISGGSIFSPGELTHFTSQAQSLGGFTSHQAFENDCTRCHAPFVGVTAERCENCHVNVETEIAAKTGIHGRTDQAAINNCAGCHQDHHGSDFNPQTLALKEFDHTATGFSLAHHVVSFDQSAIECTACHIDTSSFKLSTATCVACHTGQGRLLMPQHIQAFGVACVNCHDGVDKTHSFDHAQTTFPLTGKHANLTCNECHSASTAPQAAATNCAACHAEPEVHAGLLGTDCDVCHTTTGWKPAKLLNQTAFDHAQTSFKLDKHAHNFDGTIMNCRACHTTSDFSVTTQTCTDCHGGQDPGFMTGHVNTYGSACLDCHDGGSSLPKFDHSQFFALNGAHASLVCTSCHINQQFKGTPTECVACHKEPAVHAGVFGVQCADCHTTTAWSPAKLTQHTFPLNHGEQGEIPCATCHVATYTAYTCYGCHEHDPARVQEQHNEVNLAGRRLEDCAACHAGGH